MTRFSEGKAPHERLKAILAEYDSLRGAQDASGMVEDIRALLTERDALKTEVEWRQRQLAYKPQCDELKAEVERLRAALDWIAKRETAHHNAVGAVREMAKTARKALASPSNS